MFAVKAQFRKLNEPVTARRVLAVALLLALLAGGWFGGSAGWRWWQSRPKSTAGVKREIRAYLKKQTGLKDFSSIYDFDLRATLAALGTNAIQLREEIATLRTNLVTAQREVSKLSREAEQARDEERASKRAVADWTERLDDRTKRLAARQAELVTAQSNLVVATTNLAAVQEQMSALETNAVMLSNDVASAYAAFTNSPATNKTERAALRQTWTARQQDAATLRQKIATRRSDLAQRETRLRGVQQTSALAGTNVFLLQTNVTALSNELRARQTTFAAKQVALTNTVSALTAKQRAVRQLQTDITDREAAAVKLRRELYLKEEALSGQFASFMRHVRTNVNTAASFEIIYAYIGRALWTADRLLDSADPVQQRQAVAFAEEVAQQAVRDAENGWLGARICEAYLWPNVELVEQGGKGRAMAESVLQTCGDIFTRAGEHQNVVKNYRLLLARAQTERRADTLRYYLGTELEQAGDLAEALKVFRLVQDTNLVRQTERRISIIEQKLAKKN